MGLWLQKEGIEKELSYYQQCAKSLELAKDIRIFGLASWLREPQSKSMGAFNAFLLQWEKAYIWANLADVLMALLRNGVAYAYLLRLTLNHGLTASEFLLFFTAVSGFTGHVTGILTQFSTLHKESIDLSKVQEYLNLPEPFLFEGGAEPPATEAYELRLEDVSFRYPGSDRDILRHLDLTIHLGEKLAVVGLNGAGKTTLVMLLCGFYDPTQGRVLLNGRDIREFDRSRYYRLFSAVFQEFSILDTTIAQCVAQQFDGIDMDRIRDCIEKADLTEAVARLPQGLETHLGQEVFLDGVMLSGGQTQRLMLARALYKDGPILVLDEPTEGEILLNGIDIRKYRYDDYIGVFSVVFQDFKLISQPLGANVAGSIAYDRDRVMAALTDAGFADRLSTMDKGLDTVLYRSLYDDGLEVSGGESQKIAIARALYKDAPFIILDEPTAALDPIAEAEIYEKFNEIAGDKTAIYISHRLSTCKFCDEIAVFHDGQVIQQGNHNSLLADAAGKYHQLWYAQAQYYVTGEQCK